MKRSTAVLTLNTAVLNVLRMNTAVLFEQHGRAQPSTGMLKVSTAVLNTVVVFQNLKHSKVVLMVSTAVLRVLAVCVLCMEARLNLF